MSSAWGERGGLTNRGPLPSRAPPQPRRRAAVSRLLRLLPSSSRAGLRPLLNLSQTCFLSAILQSLIHNPLLRAYFLSEKHNRHVCYNGSRNLGIGKPYLGADGTVSSDRDKGCMCCELDRAFQEVSLLGQGRLTLQFHNEDKSPYGPITMLYSMWHASTELEGYGQQGEPIGSEPDCSWQMRIPSF